ncbi:Protein of unknown function (DUF1648) [Schinkia azotoformans MEV2011]|uniref:DUF1648 domain-containing protein n=1 Tax=Schinkia azotoformans MEV2011 TaxID=1348973 RepID=A0A072NJP4_SCHAZ|nr:DUF1648 domain-containing protein [Schinkia azotoformans]KEF37929.1 Protein of unknown function (DUF1648) [Schinkia azotoformans MEV2011]MEC1696288.1 DUF1648 domain-containing protein [Schinkia azotoformans]MEC1726793.1 DUF1648 domain-containing protein [Schinkia azotoformans]MEC1770830.1 DUF1648 domain-containing protein [Schinkia azotoformans]MEC1780806.1 DUF1648 domain-containing protein [Schinkia azotoformans]
MKWNKFDFYISIMILIPIVMIMTLYNKLPNELAIHFGTSGEPNGYQGKLFFFADKFPPPHWDSIINKSNPLY